MSDDACGVEQTGSWPAGLNRAEAALCCEVARHEYPDDQIEALLDGLASHVRQKVCEAATAVPVDETGGWRTDASAAVEHLRTRRVEATAGLAELRDRGLFDPDRVAVDRVLAAVLAGRPETVVRLGTFQLGRLASTLPEAKQRTLGADVTSERASLLEAGLVAVAPSGDERLRLSEIYVAIFSDRIGRVHREKTSGEPRKRRVSEELGWCTLAGAAAGHYLERLEQLEASLTDGPASALRRHMQMAGVTSRRGLEPIHLRAIEAYVQTDDGWLTDVSTGGTDA